MARKLRINADQIMIGLALVCVTLPIVFYLFGWTRLPVAVIGTVLLVYFSYRFMQDAEPVSTVSIAKKWSFWLLSLAVLAIWVGFSGQGGFAYQSGDFRTRNAIFRDLCQYSWPVCYDFTDLLPTARSVIGEPKPGMLSYYICWWLPVAALVKLLGCRVETGWILLYFWTLLCVFLAYYCLVRYLRRYSYLILAAFILFSGWDTVMWTLRFKRLPDGGDIEWWANYFQYSGMTTQLYWVFNQTVPVWIIIGLLLLLRGRKTNAGLCSLTFAYSPFATIGMVPIVLVAMLKNREGESILLRRRIGNALSLSNLAIPVMMLVIFGSYYMQSRSEVARSGIIFLLHPEKRTVKYYFIFLCAEVLVYFIAMGRSAMRSRFYAVVAAELILLPMFCMGKNNDFCMRASVPALLLLTVMLLEFYLDMSKPARCRKLVLLCLCIGFLSGLYGVWRSVNFTCILPREAQIADEIYSIGSPRSDNSDLVRLHINQYVALEYTDSFFYRYLARQ